MLGECFAETLEAARTGSEWAWARIYRDLAPQVTGYLRIRGATEPEDLTGEVFLQVVRDLQGFTGGEREFRSWIFVIAHHRLADESRHRARRPVEPMAALPMGAEASADAEAVALERLSAERVRRLLLGLTSDQREVLVLRVLADLTVEEVARVLGRSTGAVKALQRRGLERVARALARERVTF